MYNPNNIKTFLENTTIYPNKPAVVVEFLNSDNSITKTSIEKPEAELLLFLKLSLKNKLTTGQMSNLVTLIENYGQMMYENGCDDDSGL